MRTISQGFSNGNALRQKYGMTERDDATGFDHTWFRKNENQAGRWTSPDPYNGSMNLGNPQSFNRYSYVGNDPVNFVDPSGLMCEAIYSFSQCGGGGGFWGGGGGFGSHVAAYNENFGWLPPGVQRGLHEQIRDFERWLGNRGAVYIGAYTWGWGDGNSTSFNPGHGWVGIFNKTTGRFHIPGGLNDNARALIQDMGRRGPALLDLMLAMEAFAGLVIAAPVAADVLGTAAASQLAKTVSENLAKRTLAKELANPHIFRAGNTDNLGPLLAHFGSQAAVISQVASSIAGRLPSAAGQFTMIVRVAGYRVVVTGSISNGTPHISNFWIP